MFARLLHTTMMTSKTMLWLDADVLLLILELAHAQGTLKIFSTICRRIRELSMPVLFALMRLQPSNFTPRSFILKSIRPYVRYVGIDETGILYANYIVEP